MRTRAFDRGKMLIDDWCYHLDGKQSPDFVPNPACCTVTSPDRANDAFTITGNRCMAFLEGAGEPLFILRYRGQIDACRRQTILHDPWAQQRLR